MDGKEQKKPTTSMMLYLHGAILFGAVGLVLGGAVTDWTDGAVQYGSVIGAFVGATLGVLFARFG